MFDKFMNFIKPSIRRWNAARRGKSWAVCLLTPTPASRDALLNIYRIPTEAVFMICNFIEEDICIMLSHWLYCIQHMYSMYILHDVVVIKYVDKMTDQHHS
jgi:hypothetical protein